MLHLRMHVAYEGSHFLGWQKTPTGPSIQEALEKALETLLGQPCITEAASRTDAGVHAHEQIVGVSISQIERPLFAKQITCNKLLRGLNALLPKTIVIKHLEETTSTFHPSIDAKYKEYHYQIVYGHTHTPFLRNFSWHYPQFLDVNLMKQGIPLLLGVHDFSSFCNERNLCQINPICHLLKIVIEEDGLGYVKIRVFGNRFLYKMVRNLVGTLVYVGAGKLKVNDLPNILQARNRILAGMTAPAKGLFLHRVSYEPFS